LTLDYQGVVDLVADYEKQVRALKRQALEFTWHMRGGLTYDQAMQLGHSEKEIINEIIKSHMETTKTSGLPFF
jgi:hypothetical protein